MPDHTSPGEAPSLRIAPGLGNVLFDVWLVSRAVHALVDDAIGETGLDADEYAIYSVLSSGEPMTPTDLARWMAAPPTTVSSYIKRFERRGHLVRRSNPADGRSSLVELTAAGQQAHRAASERFGPVLAEIESALGDEAAPAHQQLRMLHDVVDAHRRPT